VARRRQKAALGTIRPVGLLARRNQRVADGTALGHVANRSRHEILVAIAERRETNARGKFRAIGASCKQVADPRPHFAADRLAQEVRQVRSVSGVKSLRNQQLDRLADEPIGRVTEYAAGGLIRISNDALGVHDEHRVGGELQ
jgi:hypothetical protein